MPDTIILPLANALLDCLEQEALLNPDPPAEFCLRTGTLVIHDFNAELSTDKTCCPGLGYVRLGRVYPSSVDFPAPDPRSEKCLSLARALELTVGIVRCIPGMASEAGPTCADWTAAATHDADDIQALFSALCCWVESEPFKRRVRERPYTVLESNVVQEGDCIERFITVLVQIPKCC